VSESLATMRTLVISAYVLLTVIAVVVFAGCRTVSQSMMVDRQIERGKRAAVAAVQSPSTWRRVRGERLTSCKLTVEDGSGVGHRLYVAEMDTVSYREGETLDIYSVPTGMNFGLHGTFVDVTVRRDNGEVLAMREDFHP
jgi:hypothetical protein